MEIIKNLMPPFIGAVIGYCTNYIAVKMLFRPYKPIKIGHWKIPFTPGIIPKRQPELAKAVGHAVGTKLLGENEIQKILQSEQMKESVIHGMMQSADKIMQEKTVRELGTSIMKEENYEAKKEDLTDLCTDRILSGIYEMNIAEILKAQIVSAVRGMGGMIAMFVNEDLIAAVTGPIGEKVNAFLEEYGKGFIRDKVSEQLKEAEQKHLADFGIMESGETLKNSLCNAYDTIVEENFSKIIETFDISGIVEEKINAMDIAELEDLIMSVMKHELGMIVNLGALIGFVLGLVNLLFV